MAMYELNQDRVIFCIMANGIPHRLLAANSG